MSTVKNGVVEWGEPTLGNGKGGNEFLRLNPGPNIVRLVTLPHQYHQHRYEPAGGQKWGYRINCSRSETEDRCPLCEMGNKAKRRWFVGVIERKNGKYMILDIGSQVFKMIQELAKGPWGVPDSYDVNIAVDPNGGASNYYFVSPMPPTQLSADDIRLKEENPVSKLEERVSSPTPQSVKDRMNKILEEIANSGSSSDSDEDEEEPKLSKKESDDEDFFKKYTKKKAG